MVEKVKKAKELRLCNKKKLGKRITEGWQVSKLKSPYKNMRDDSVLIEK